MANAFLEPLLGSVVERAGQPAWLAASRQLAREQLERDGLPGPRSEPWKYTSLRALGQRRYQPGDAEAATRAIEPGRLELAGVEGPRLVFVNGCWRADLSCMDTVPGVRIERLADVLAREPEALRSALERRFDDPSEAFARLNTAMLGDGLVIRVDAGVRDTPLLHVVLCGAATSAEVSWNLRILIELGAGSALRVVEHQVGEENTAQLGNVLTQIRLDAGARLDFLQVQNASESASCVRRTEAELAADAHFEQRAIEAGAQWMRHDLAVHLAGDRARFVSRGVFAVRGRQHADTRLDVRHQARDTACDIVWRGVADGRARGIFHGGITVEPGADGSDAQLNNKNLLLSAQAEIDTQPVLEIHADEVKAAHGATVGQLDERALFYLRSRGLDAEQARALLTLAFCRIAFDSIENEALRSAVDALLLERLPTLASELDSAGASA